MKRFEEFAVLVEEYEVFHDIPQHARVLPFRITITESPVCIMSP
jgi:hypothetical protein